MRLTQPLRRARPARATNCVGRDSVEPIELLLEVGNGGEASHPLRIVSDLGAGNGPGRAFALPEAAPAGSRTYAALTSDLGGTITLKVGAALPFTL